jgi:hypothetical protein
MNSDSTESSVKNTLSASGPEFFPTNAKWINCHNYMFLPHSNECGIWTLLALSIRRYLRIQFDLFQFDSLEVFEREE